MKGGIANFAISNGFADVVNYCRTESRKQESQTALTIHRQFTTSKKMQVG
jgi:hypothetical protein